MVPFPPLLAATLGVLGAAFVVRHVAREWQRAKDAEREENASVAKSKNKVVPTLRRDPQTGIYRP